MILPTHSLKFSQRWGKIRQISPSLGLPVAVKFSHAGMSYWFDYNEVITEEFYEKHRNDPAACRRCGTDLSGQFIEVCNDCDFEMFEEDIQQWQK